MNLSHFVIIALCAMMAAIPINAISAEHSPVSNLSIQVVAERQVDDVQLFDGIVEAINFSTLSSQTSGKIAGINFDVDDFVKAGDIIVQFGDIEHKAKLSQAKSTLTAAIAARTGANESFKRINTLFERGSAAKARLDTARVSFDVSKANVKTATAAVEQAQEQLGYTIVRAPYSGIVVKRHVEVGEVANPGQALMSGFSLENLRVKVSVPQQFANLIRREKRATIYDGSGGSIAADKLTVFPYADEKSNTVTIRAALPQSTKLIFPGMLVKVAFKTGSREMLLIQESAMVNRGEVNGVYLIDDNATIYLQQIRTGRTIDGEIEVLSGLKAGDKIATEPYEALLALKSKSGNLK
ncbi:MAG: efflux RND transporter periplasmic adaptor subunit [Hyphomicrobiales bacterium]|nr:efflux RND transporter periplasmic adaptor subunit [Hyphomicrobiales bacterium]